MPKAYSLDLRERVAGFVDSGRSRHAGAAHFKVSVSFVVNLMKAYRMTGRLTPKPGGGRRHAKLDPHRAFLLARVAEKDDITMPELAAELVAATGTRADPRLDLALAHSQRLPIQKNAAGQRTRSARRQTSTRGVDGHAATKNAA
jgi:transposase